MPESKNNPRAMTKKHVAKLERERQQVNTVRTVAFAMFGLIALLLGYGYFDTAYLQPRKPVATVNGEKITIKDWQERIQFERSNLMNQYQQYQYYQDYFGMDLSQQIQQITFYLQYPEQLGQQVLDQMIDDTLVRQEAAKLNITVSDEEVEASFQESYRYFPDGTPTPTITPTAFVLEYPTFTSQQLTLYPHTATPTEFVTVEPSATPTLDPAITPTATFTAPPPTVTFTAAPPTPTFVPEDVTPTATAYTFDGYKERYQTTVDQMSGFGVSEKTLREVYRTELLRKKLIEAIVTDVATVDTQIQARHILVDDAQLAETVREKLVNGANFIETAKEYSKDTGSAVNGGDLGWFGKGAMVAPFEDAAFSLEIGEISPVVQSDFGYHIIQVIAKQERPLTASQIEQNRQVAFVAWLQTVRETADIVTPDGWQSLIPPMPDFSGAASQ